MWMDVSPVYGRGGKIHQMYACGGAGELRKEQPDART